MFLRVLMVAGLTVMPVLAQAQTGADSVAIVEAASRWYAPREATSSRVGFSLRNRSRSGRPPTVVQREAARQGARILHATVVPDDLLGTKLCDRKKPGNCTPAKFDVIVEVGLITITGNASEVFVHQWKGNGPGPSQHGMDGWILRFVRSPDGWVFDRMLSEIVT